jgi:hypothetical protein
MRAIFIDAVNHTVEEIDLPYETEGYRVINDKIGCRTMTLGYTFPNQDVLFVDDEGLMNHPENFIILEGYEQPLAGSGLILGTDEWGESIPAKTGLADIKTKIAFANAEAVREWFRLANVERAQRIAEVNKNIGGDMNVIHVPYPEI